MAASGLAGPRWGFEGFLPRTGRERRERLARIARGRAGDGAVRGADAARGHAARSRRGVRRGPAGRRVPRAHEAPRADRPRHARRARGGGRGRDRSRCAARSSIVVGRSRSSRGSRRRLMSPRASTPRRRSAPVDALVRGGACAARVPPGGGRGDGMPRRTLYDALERVDRAGEPAEEAD